jgi:aminoglycoside 2'-N-acetyltransferase I
MSDLTSARLRRLPTDQLTATELAAIRDLMGLAFGSAPDDAFTEEDWQHTIGGTHFVLEVAGEIISHASVIERELHVDGRPLRTGYVEAVATLPQRQGMGHGTRVMGEVNDYVAANFELGALGTSSQGFYERLGWQIWRGPTFVRTPAGDQRTQDEDGGILVLLTPASPPDLVFHASISCEWRPGDVW